MAGIRLVCDGSCRFAGHCLYRSRLFLDTRFIGTAFRRRQRRRFGRWFVSPGSSRILGRRVVLHVVVCLLSRRYGQRRPEVVFGPPAGLHLLRRLRARSLCFLDGFSGGVGAVLVVQEEDVALRAFFNCRLVVFPILGKGMAAMDRHIRTKNGGFMLTELLVAVAVLLLLLSSALPRAGRYGAAHAVDLAARETVMELQHIREHALGNGKRYGDRWIISLRSGGYTVLHNGAAVRERSYPKNVCVASYGGRQCYFEFDDKGKPLGKHMQIILRQENAAYERKIIIAAQTGRIRIE